MIVEIHAEADADAETVEAADRGRLRARRRGRRRGRARGRRRGSRPIEAAEDDRPGRGVPRAACASRLGDWYVVHSYAGYENKVKTNLESRITSLNMEDYIFQVEVPHGGGHRDQERPAQAGQAQQVPRLRPGAHGPHRRVLGRRAPHAGRHRLRGPRPPARRRCRWTRSSRSWRPSPRQKPGAARPPAAAPARSRSSTSRSATRSPSSTAPSPRCTATISEINPDTQKLNGPGVDLRPGDPGRARLQPGPEELTSRPPRRAADHAPRRKDPKTCLPRRRSPA